MPLIVKDTASSYEMPTPGLHNAVCVDVHDAGVEETPWGPKEKVLIVFEIDEEHPEFGGPFRVNRKYNLSLHEKASLTQDLEGWRGKGFTAEEKKGFDLEKLLGAPCTLNIVHNETDSGTYANIKGVMPLQKGADKMQPSEGYVRIQDREDRPNDRSANGRLSDQPDPQPSAGNRRDDGDGFAAQQDAADLPF